MSSSTVNLPAIVTNVGGALEKVVRELDLYTDPSHPLSERGRVELARFVELRPDLNHEHYVALIVDALAYHGVDSAPELGRTVDDFDTEIVHQALDYLYEVGKRGRGAEEKGKTDWFGDTGIRAVCQLLVDLDSEGHTYDTVEGFTEAIFALGGLDEAVTLSENELAETLDAVETDGDDSNKEEEGDAD